MTQSPATFASLRVGQLLYPFEQVDAAVKVLRLSKTRVTLRWLHHPGDTQHGAGSFDKGRWCVDAYDVSGTVKRQRKIDRKRMVHRD